MMIAYAMNIFNVVLNLYFVFLQKIHIEFVQQISLQVRTM